MKSTGRVLAEVVFVLLAPIVAVALFQISLIHQDGYLDPWIYTGLGQNFRLLQSLHGWTYPEVRFPVVFLNSALPGSLDAVTGYVALRYVLFLVCGGSLYLWARAYFGVLVAGAAYLFLVCNPLLPRALDWDLTTFVSIPSALAGICIWLLPVQHVGVTRFLAGFLFCTAIASQALSGTAILAFLVTETLGRFSKREVHALIVYDLVATAAGALVCLGLGVLYYFFQVGSFDPTVILTMTLVGMKAAYVQGRSSQSLQWLATDYAVYVPYFLVIVGAAGLGRGIFSETMEARLVRFGLLYASAYGLYQFIWHGLLETFYYFSYLAIVAYLLFPLSLSLIMSKLQLLQKRWIALVALGLLIALPLVYRLFPQMFNAIAAGSHWTVVLIGLVFTCGAVLIRLPGRLHLQIVTTVLVVGFIQVISFSDHHHRMVFANSLENNRQFSVYRAAIQMMEIFSAFSRPDAQVLLWYPFDASMHWRARNSMQSLAFLGLPQLQVWGQQPGLPALSDHGKAKLLDRNVRYVMMVSEQPDKLDRGREALERNGYIPLDIVNRTIGGEAFEVHLRLVEITNAGPIEEILASAVSVPLDQLTPEAAAVVSNVGDVVVGRSVPKAWAYIGKLDLRACCVAGGGWVAVELRVKTGSIGVGILNRSEDDFLVRRFVKAAEGIQVIFLPVQSYRETTGLIVQNGKSDISSEVEIRRVMLTFNNLETPSGASATDSSSHRGHTSIP